jgi:predicted ester cyclase
MCYYRLAAATRSVPKTLPAARGAVIRGESMTPVTTSIKTVAEEFFAACETGKGWEICSAYCKPNATFSAQAEPLVDVKSLAQYTEWMKGILAILPDGHYEVRSFATDIARNNVAAYGVFYGTHTGQGGPVPPTGRRIATDYVYVMQFEGDKIAHMTKVWNAGLALKDLGWA